MQQKLKSIVQMLLLIGVGFGLLLFAKFDGRNGKVAPNADAVESQPTEVVTASSKSQPAPGYTIYPISGPELINLLNLKGEVVHQWKNIDVERVRLLPNCNILTLHGSKLNLAKKPWSELLNRASEYDWNGNLVWSYTAPYHLHHDLQRLPNGNTLVMEKVPLPEDQLAKITDSLRKKFEIIADVIVEVDPSGKVVWQWNSWDHLDVNSCGEEKCLGMEDHPLNNREMQDIADWTHFNTLGVLPENKWFDAGDERFRPGNLITVARNFSEILIIDRASGEVVWRYNGDYRGGMVRGHEASMIPPGFPGAGNIIVLDNGFDDIREESYILEIEPPSKKVVWSYSDGKRFYTRARGSVQRLANGNTLISEDRSARAFEVDPAGKVVWEYQGDGKIIIRAHRYPVDHCPKLKELS